jgi:hypothetical protein
LAATVTGVGVRVVSAAPADVVAPPRHSARTQRDAASERDIMAGLPGVSGE